MSDFTHDSRARGAKTCLVRAVALGAVQGPAELLPVSSSAHIELAAGLIGWPDDGPEARKAFEVALHAGAAASLAFVSRGELGRSLRSMSRRRATVALLAAAPAAAAGFWGRRVIEERLSGGPATVAGLAGGGLAMAVADLVGTQRRAAGDTSPSDGLALGVAQAAALVPGVSRSGATLTAARLRGFDREQAARLSWGVALPVIAGALALEAPALGRGLRHPRTRGPLIAGTASAAASTAMAARILGPPVRARRLWPFAAYRLVLAALAARRPVVAPGPDVRLNGPVSCREPISA